MSLKPSTPTSPAPAATPEWVPESERLALAARRRLYFRYYAAALMLALLAIGTVWWLTARDLESTDDAYVAGDVVQVMPQISGTAVTVMARNTDWVDAGTPLLELDRTDATLALDSAVEQLAHGQVGAAVESLDRQGRVHEVKGHEERISAIAHEYAKAPESTLVVSPDNRSRARSINGYTMSCNRAAL